MSRHSTSLLEASSKIWKEFQIRNWRPPLISEKYWVSVTKKLFKNEWRTGGRVASSQDCGINSQRIILNPAGSPTNGGESEIFLLFRSRVYSASVTCSATLKHLIQHWVLFRFIESIYFFSTKPAHGNWTWMDILCARQCILCSAVHIWSTVFNTVLESI